MRLPADRLGYEYPSCPEHVVVPMDASAQRDSTHWEPLATFGLLAARTMRIRRSMLAAVALSEGFDVLLACGPVDPLVSCDDTRRWTLEALGAPADETEG